MSEQEYGPQRSASRRNRAGRSRPGQRPETGAPRAPRSGRDGSSAMLPEKQRVRVCHLMLWSSCPWCLTTFSSNPPRHGQSRGLHAPDNAHAILLLAANMPRCGGAEVVPILQGDAKTQPERRLTETWALREVVGGVVQTEATLARINVLTATHKCGRGGYLFRDGLDATAQPTARHAPGIQALCLGNIRRATLPHLVEIDGGAAARCTTSESAQALLTLGTTSRIERTTHERWIAQLRRESRRWLATLAILGDRERRCSKRIKVPKHDARPLTLGRRHRRARR